MAAYAYRAAHASGRIHKGRITAQNENELAFHLRQLDLELIEAKKVTRAVSPLRSEKIDLRHLVGFCRQMESLLRAGIPFDDAVGMVIETLPAGSILHARLVTAAQAIRAGGTVRASFAATLFSFDPVFIALLESGEKSGDLAATFARLAKYLNWQNKLKTELSRALRYPLFLMAVVFAVTGFMMGFVVPELVGFLTSLGGSLPLATRLLIKAAALFETLWWLVPSLSLFTAAGIWIGRKTSRAFAEGSDAWLLALPALGGVLRKLALARFATSLVTLLKSGLSLQDSLRIAAPTLGNSHLAAQAREAGELLASGSAFSQATSGLFPPVILQTIKVGEKSGSLPNAMEDIAATYETETQESVSAFLGTLEPALTILVGAFLVWIVLAVLGPVYGSLGPLAGGI